MAVMLATGPFKNWGVGGSELCVHVHESRQHIRASRLHCSGPACSVVWGLVKCCFPTVLCDCRFDDPEGHAGAPAFATSAAAHASSMSSGTGTSTNTSIASEGFYMRAGGIAFNRTPGMASPVQDQGSPDGAAAAAAAPVAAAVVAAAAAAIVPVIGLGGAVVPLVAHSVCLHACLGVVRSFGTWKQPSCLLRYQPTSIFRCFRAHFCRWQPLSGD